MKAKKIVFVNQSILQCLWLKPGNLEEGPDALKDTWCHYRSMGHHTILWPLFPLFLLSLDFLEDTMYYFWDPKIMPNLTLFLDKIKTFFLMFLLPWKAVVSNTGINSSSALLSKNIKECLLALCLLYDK